MRKLLALILLAGTATPALAAGDPRDMIRAHSDHRGSQQQNGSEPSRGQSDNHPSGNSGQSGDHSSGNSGQPSAGGNTGGERSHGRFERSGGNDQSQPVTHVESSGGGQAGEPRFHHGVVSRISSGGQSQAVQPAQQNETSTGDTGRRWHGPKVIEAPVSTPVTTDPTPTLREPSHRTPSVFRNRVPIVSNTPHEGTQPPLRTENRRTNWVNWSTSHWRNDRRYDWKDHRRRHRSLFHLGFYYDPFGWNYRPYQIGWRLWPSYYNSRFWISDPWQYRLPYAPPGYRWIRYYDDAILIDTWDGRVVDVIYNFFW